MGRELLRLVFFKLLHNFLLCLLFGAVALAAMMLSARAAPSVVDEVCNQAQPPAEFCAKARAAKPRPAEDVYWSFSCETNGGARASVTISMAENTATVHDEHGKTVHPLGDRLMTSREPVLNAYGHPTGKWTYKLTMAGWNDGYLNVNPDMPTGVYLALGTHAPYDCIPAAPSQEDE